MLLTFVIIWKSSYQLTRRTPYDFLKVFLKIEDIWICLFHCYFWYYIRFSKSFSTSNLNISVKSVRRKIIIIIYDITSVMSSVFINVKFFQSSKVERESISLFASEHCCYHPDHLSLLEKWSTIFAELNPKRLHTSPRSFTEPLGQKCCRLNILGT